MKTITEYQPLIYAALFAEPARRRSRQRQTIRKVAALLLFLYFVGVLTIMADTGMAIWNWEFWVMFLPFFAVGERVLWAMNRRAEQMERSNRSFVAAPVGLARPFASSLSALDAAGSVPLP